MKRSIQDSTDSAETVSDAVNPVKTIAQDFPQGDFNDASHQVWYCSKIIRDEDQPWVNVNDILKNAPYVTVKVEADSVSEGSVLFACPFCVTHMGANGESTKRSKPLIHCHGNSRKDLKNGSHGTRAAHCHSRKVRLQYLQRMGKLPLFKIGNFEIVTVHNTKRIDDQGKLLKKFRSFI